MVLALVLAGLVTFYPPAVASLSHGLITLVIWGMSAGFVHGIGFDPDGRFWRIVLGPVSAWALMGMGLFLIAKSYL
ncbi:MAG: Cyd operon protein YbgE [Sulfuriferula sp.]|nr:Cyd operon protein YbgE [Sulfuriferula sp.]